MIGNLWMRLQGISMEKIDFDDLSEEEIDEILLYSGTNDNIEERYVVACQIIANMIEQLESEVHSNNEMVDLTICKMMLDGYVDIEKNNHKYH